MPPLCNPAEPLAVSIDHSELHGEMAVSHAYAQLFCYFHFLTTHVCLFVLFCKQDSGGSFGGVREGAVLRIPSLRLSAPSPFATTGKLGLGFSFALGT